MYDAIVVGARCAGSPTAMLLARKGYRVLVVDRATFPSDALSTHAMGGDCGERLDRWGLLDRVLATGCPQVKGFAMKSEGVGFEMPNTGPYPLIAPRRTLLDKILVDAAREAGAEVREGFSVRALTTEDGRVTGISGVDASGAEVTEEARIVIGADGRNSFVARRVAAEEYDTLPARGVAYYSYWSGFAAPDWFEIHFAPGSHGVFVFPTNDNLVCLGAGFPIAEFERVKAGPEAAMMAAIAATPAVADRARNAKREERLMGWSGYESYYRKPFGPGWALVGDAGYLKDPTLGQGINDCFRDAEYLSEALDAAWSGRADVDAALAAYQQRRDTETAQIYRINDLVSSGNTTGDLLQVLGAVMQGRNTTAEAQKASG
jgi:flavin-dependent dehydrogenase